MVANKGTIKCPRAPTRALFVRLPSPINYILTIQVDFATLWACGCKAICPSFNYFKIIWYVKYKTEKCLALKENKISYFKKKQELLEVVKLKNYQ